MSNKGRYCWIENDGKYKCDHLKQQLQQAQQETAREIMQMIDVDIANSRMWVNEIRDKFKLEG